jgi:hypothetical protein
MRVPPGFLKSVAFIAEVISSDSSGEDLDLLGTGFFVSSPSSVMPGTSYHLFVTAKHVMKGLKDKKVKLIVNSTHGGTTTLPIIGDRWFVHPTDKTADVAVIPFGSPDENKMKDLDICPISIKDFVTPELLEKTFITIGDEVFIPGLFTFAPGHEKNIPIVRHGNIAMLPDEAIQIDNGFAEVYLIEARSIGGISGSPVIARRTVGMQSERTDGSKIIVQGLTGFHLLGLIHGHWDITESEMNSYQFIHDRQRGVNLGIAVVVPAHKILETANHPVLVAAREAQEQKMKDAIGPGKDKLQRSN